ncbi:MAG: hypothetical protein ACW981_10805 [Candidatus Hodarchaeales archaeon]|jgi:hypothetical protein
MSSVEHILSVMLSSFLNGDINSLTALLSLIQIPPAILCIRNYLTVKSRDYLLVATFFIVGIINKFVITLLFNPAFWEFQDVANIVVFIVNSSYFIWTFSFFVYFLYVKWINPPKILLYGNYILLIGWHIIITLDLILAINPSITEIVIYTQMQPIFVWILRIWPLLASLFCFYVYFTIKPMNNERTTQTVIWMWRLVGIILSFEFGKVILFQFIEGDIETFFISFAIMHLLFASIALFYPESFLISQTQFIRAQKMYKKIKENPEEIEPSHFGMHRILSYLNNIPESVLEELNSEIQKDLT